ncbi:MAG: DinB family protein [Bacteroidota bacterium]
MKKLLTLTICLFLSTLTLKSIAQGLKAEDMRAQMVKDWERAKAYTIDYLNAIPADKYSFKAVDSIRSFAQQMLHLAAGNIFLMANATDEKPLPFVLSDREKATTAQGKDSIMYYVTASYDYCIDAVRNYDVNKWGEKKKLHTYEEYRWSLMMKAFEHQTHHRGQATIYIRLLGIRPPQERLF